MRARLALVLLVTHADANGSCFPTQHTLAAEMGAHERTARRALRELRAAGVIDVVPGRQHFATRYTIRTDRVASLGAVRPVSDAPLQTGQERVSPPANTGTSVRPAGRFCPTRAAPASDDLPTQLPTELPKDSQVSDQRPHDTGGGTAAPDGYVDVLVRFERAYLQAKGCRPIISSRERKAAKTLVALVGLAEALEIVDIAFGDDFVLSRMPDLAYIVNHANAFRGARRRNGKLAGQQRITGDEPWLQEPS